MQASRVTRPRYTVEEDIARLEVAVQHRFQVDVRKPGQHLQDTDHPWHSEHDTQEEWHSARTCQISGMLTCEDTVRLASFMKLRSVSSQASI